MTRVNRGAGPGDDYTQIEQSIADSGDTVRAHLMRELRFAVERADIERRDEVWRRLLKHLKLPMWLTYPEDQTLPLPAAA